MPVPTQTFRNMTVMNVIFFFSALALIASTGWLIVADHYKSNYRGYQTDALAWEHAMLVDAQQAYISNEYLSQQRDIQADIAALNTQDTQQLIVALQADVAKEQANKETEEFRLSIEKGVVGPTQQRLERARLELSEDSPQIIQLKNELADVLDKVNKRSATIAGIDRTLADRAVEIAEAQQAFAQQTGQLTDLQRQENTIADKLKTVAPTGAAALTDKFRNAPLTDWFNASLRVQQVVTHDVRTDYNLVQTETYDRCMSCHINIDKPAYEKSALILFTERQVALGEQQKLAPGIRPVVLLEFWEQAAHVAGLDEAVAALDKTDPPGYRDDLLALLQAHLGTEQFDLLGESYRYALIDQYNQQRAEKGQAPLSADPVLLGHPKIDLFMGPDSKHPMMAFGCTVCHEGSGQETQFVYTAHTPRPIWVDADTGAPVPQFLIEQTGEPAAIRAHIENSASRAAVRQQQHGADVIAIAADQTADSQLDGDHGRYVSDHLFLADASDGRHPFAPDHGNSTAAAYVDPADPTRPHEAVRQEQYWAQTLGWHHVHYTHWEKPMHALEYVESSCAKCHTEIYDIPDDAPLLFEGRKLFAQQGCANCHSVTALDDALDVKKVGPSLMHAAQKLSPQMMATWMWAPKAFRPTTRMPHYFMLENNSAPVDILRTRTEVTAITYYLQTATPNEQTYRKLYQQDNALSDRQMALTKASQYLPAAYTPQTPPPIEGTAEESIERGRQQFTELGCLACHVNISEYGEGWIVDDLSRREGLAAAEAKAVYDALGADQADGGYNARRWYILRYLPQKLTLGPDLSDIGSKLMAGRSEQQARTWLYTWIRDPRHYSSYTIMPSLRLTEQEANDISSYLLAQQRPGYEGADSSYQPQDFGFGEQGPDEPTKAMLGELVANLLAGQSTLELAHQRMIDEPDPQNPDAKLWTVDYQLNFLGEKMISHYGCAGCHAINGFENAVSACTTLDDWGLKDPHKLDFGYFDHAFDKVRSQPRQIWHIDSEGLAPDAPLLGHDSEQIEQPAVAWEHLHAQERRPWAYQKLHNTRIYDRGRNMLDGYLVPDEPISFVGPNASNVGRPYDKLKMPKFYLSDDQVRALITYVTSIRKPLVSVAMQNRTSNQVQTMTAHGRQLATLFNCYGCHNIEGNEVRIHEYFNVYNENGTSNDNALNWTPPRLLGQGAKTQPDWLYHFLQNVNGQPNVPEAGETPPVGESKIRAWLKIRMPSFPLDPQQAAGLVDYFAGHSQLLAAELAGHVAAIETYLGTIDEQIAQTQQFLTLNAAQLTQLAAEEQTSDGAAIERRKNDKARFEKKIEQLTEQRSTWYKSDNTSVQQAVAALHDFALRTDLTTPRRLDPRRRRPTQLYSTWSTIYLQAKILASAWQTDYPYSQKSLPVVDEIDFARGEKLFAVMGCTTGECHRVGDESLIVAAGFDIFADGVAAAGATEADDAYGDDEAYGDEDEYPAEQDTTTETEEEAGYEDEDGYGEQDAYGEDEYGEQGAAGTRVTVQPAPNAPPPGAPNLNGVAHRLQRRWVEHWLRYSGTMQPKTRMLEHWAVFQSWQEHARSTEPKAAKLEDWPGFHKSHMAPQPQDIRDEIEPLVGYTAEQQQKYLLDWLYNVGPRGITYAPDLVPTRLSHQRETPLVIPPLEPPSQEELAALQPATTASTLTVGGGQTTAAAETTAPDTAVEPQTSTQIADFHDETTTAYEGTRIIGMVKVDGTLPRRTPVRMQSDQFCANAHKARPALNETYVFNRDLGTLQNVLVYVKSGLEGKSFDALTEPAILNQQGCMYVPHVLAVMQGQPITILNSDQTSHNVHTTPKENDEFNIAQAFGVVLRQTFTEPEFGIPFKCDIHSWMQAYVHVLEHPFFAVTDIEGKFEIKDLPPGTYTLETWHEDSRISPVQFEVTVAENTSVRADTTVSR